MNRTAVLVPSVLLAAALSVTACSSSTKGKGAAAGSTGKSSTSSAPVTSSSSSTPAASAPDKAKLASFLLTAADVPSGWTGSPSDNSSSTDDAEQAKLATCLGIPDSTKQKVAEADSDDFTLNESSISSSATSFSSQSAVDSDVQIITSPKASSCLKQMFQDAVGTDLPEGAKIDALDITLSPGSNGGPENLAGIGHAKITVTAQGQTVSLYADVAFIKGNLVEAEVEFFGFGAPIPEAAQRKAITAVAQRVAAG